MSDTASIGEEAAGVEVTAIESGGRRVTRCGAGLIGTLWTRAIERVAAGRAPVVGVAAGWPAPCTSR